MLDVSRRMISILVSSIFTCQRRVTFVKRCLSTVTIIHSGWNMQRSPTFSNPTVLNMSVDECSLNPIRSDSYLERQSHCLCSWSIVSLEHVQRCLRKGQWMYGQRREQRRLDVFVHDGKDRRETPSKETHRCVEEISRGKNSHASESPKRDLVFRLSICYTRTKLPIHANWAIKQQHRIPKEHCSPVMLSKWVRWVAILHHLLQMFYRIHASTLKYLNHHSKQSEQMTIEKLTELCELLTEMQQKPFATSYYEKSTM